jgi:hypothetical protein
VNCKSSELLHAAGLERDLAAAGGGGRNRRRPGLSRPVAAARFPIGLAVCMTMLALLACLGGAAAAPSYPEVATPSPLARFVLGPLPQRRAACVADSGCSHPRLRSLPPSP